MRDSLARYVPKASMTEAQVKALGARAWEEQETLVVRLNQITDPMLRAMVVAIAKHLFGRAS